MKLLTAALLAALIASAARAIDLKTIEQYGVEQVYSTKTYITGSSHTVVGYMTQYDVRVIGGGGGQFLVKHSTVAGNIDVNTSSTVYVATGTAVSRTVKGIMYNPTLLLTQLDPLTTAYINIWYLAPRGNGLP